MYIAKRFSFFNNTITQVGVRLAISNRGKGGKGEKE